MRPFFKVIACEILFRELTHLAAECPNLIDLEFLTQGLHDIPRSGGTNIQQRIDSVPAGKYDAILLGYGLCGFLVSGLKARHTPLVIPRAHDCITLFVGSKERYNQTIQQNAGTYFYTSGWLECLRRRGVKESPGHPTYLPTRAGDASGTATGVYEEWVQLYGEERAHFLLQEISKWTANYTHGALIDFDFTGSLHLEEQVQAICRERGWEFRSIPGDLGLLRRWLAGDWADKDFQIVAPGERIVPRHDEAILTSEAAGK